MPTTRAKSLRLAAEKTNSTTPAGDRTRLVEQRSQGSPVVGRTWLSDLREDDPLGHVQVLEKGLNSRFVVTTHREPPLVLYDWYVQRGTPEQWIDDRERACFADRLSCHRFWANQFHLLLNAAAYWLVETLRRWLGQRGDALLRLDTLRLRLIKIGGWVRQQAEGFRLHLTRSYPAEPLWRLLMASFHAP